MIDVTTLCYIDNGSDYLMLHRNKKEQDINKDKYIGIGGHVNIGESPNDCIKREAIEETGYILDDIKLRGIITFVMDDTEELTFLYTCNSYHGIQKVCDEGDLCWIPKSKINTLPLWEGDKIFLDLLEARKDVFSLKLNYIKGELIGYELD